MSRYKNYSQQRFRLSRREFLVLGGVGIGVGVGAGVAIFNQTGLLKGDDPAQASQQVASTGNVRSYTFEAAPVSLMVGGKQVSTWAYNGVAPGPEIRVTEGDTLRVTVKNRLQEGTTIHWHGVPLVNPMDGVPDVTQPAIKPGQDFVYEFVAPAAGTYLYHSHAGLQLDRGLYGPLIIEPAKETMKYDQEFVLVLDDWLDGLPGIGTPEKAMKQLIAGGDRMGNMNANNGGGMGGMDGMNGMDAMPGMSGMDGMPKQTPPDLLYPLYLMNGKGGDAPLELSVKKGDKARIRIINASASSIYRVALQGHRLTVTHTDGQPVEPVEVDALRIGMGERYDVLVSANNPGLWQLAAQVEGTMKGVRALVRYKGSSGQTPPATFLPPEMMRLVLQYKMLKAAPELVVPPSRTPDQLVPLQLSGGMGQYVWKINNQVFPKADLIKVARNGLVRFQFESMSMMPHPMHLHGHFFQVDNGTGRGPLKDTVMVDPKQKFNINWVANNPGAWAFHCHNRYHEDAGMMRVVKVS